MKKLISIIFVLLFANSINAQFAFGVKPGVGLNGAYFGFKASSFVLFANVDYTSVGGAVEETGKKFDYDIYGLVSFKDESEASFSIYNLGVGAKFLFPSKSKISPYITATFSKPIISAEAKQNGESEEELSDYIDAISIWGASLGFGTEYFFSENFSIGGEFGLRMFLGSYEKSEIVETYVYNPNTGSDGYVETERNYNVDVNFSLTYSVVSFNYYF